MTRFDCRPSLDALTESEHPFRKLVEAWPDAILIHSDEKIVFVNPFCAGLLAADGSEQLLGKGISEIVSPEDLPAIRSRIRNCYLTGLASPPMESTLIACDGSSVEIEAVAIPITWNGCPAIEVVLRDIRGRKRAEQAADEWQQRLELAAKGGLRIGLWDWDVAANTVTWSDETYRQFGFTRDTFSGHVDEAVTRIHPEDLPGVEDAIRSVLAGAGEYSAQYRLLRPDGSTCWIDAHGLMVRNGSPHMIGVGVDITERRNLEEQFRQAQKMEAVGLLAGGISHDFNNLLSIILGNSDLLLATAQSSAQQHYAEEIQRAGRRAAQLTRQLLAFSRKQVLYPTVLDLNSIVRDLGKILQRMIGEDVQIMTDLAADLGSIRDDRGQIEHILMNLATNARDAMPNGGRFTIRTRNAELGLQDAARYPDVRPGKYIRLSVSDTGVGMSEEVRVRIFEPFFTTKPLGRGTGLGLATVYGMVKHSNGYIWVSSEPNSGATFDIYLPRVNEKVPPLLSDSEVRGEYPRGAETILLLEDEEALRLVFCEFLKASGYHVLQAARGDEAIDLAAQYHRAIPLMISDIVLPDRDGPSVVAKVQKIHPETKSLYVSGYAERPVVQELVSHGATLMQKPVSRRDLLEKVDELLHSSTTSPR